MILFVLLSTKVIQ